MIAPAFVARTGDGTLRILAFLSGIPAAAPAAALAAGLLAVSLPAAAQQAVPPAGTAPATPPAPGTATVATYTVVPGDRLTITVLEDPNLNSQVLVRPDGRITLPIAGSILVAGKSPEEIQAIVRGRLATSFTVTPTVNVALTSIAIPGATTALATAVTIYVLGEVNKPGVLQVTPPQTLNVLQALAQAGGLGRFAKGEAIQIRRVDATTGAETVFRFDYEALEAGRTLADNIPLMDGDVIFVPERGLFD
jgi:polysaccharide export outer membrane protein